MRFKPFLTAVITGTFVLAAPPLVSAHSGGAPKHGGVVSAASELAFELVASPDGATLYVEDHGKPMPSAGISGKLTVLNGTEKSEAELRPAGENRLEAKGVKVAKGSKSVASLSVPGRKPMTVRFTHR